MTAHCCEMMRDNVEKTCPDHPDRYDCADCLIDYWPISQTYGIMIRNEAGGGMIVIQFCPWCGIKLPEEIGSEEDG